ncbi:MAG: MarR family transcriptional regulator [Woeseiaceae bacterium]|nr:MarR family transcriptional regulator [Woeseiaceae bacterium]
MAIHVDRFMRRIHGGLHAQASEFDTENVGPGGGMILMTLADVEPAPVQLIARLMARDKSQMTRAIKVLERKGLISRSDEASDARVSLLHLTAKGRRTVDRIQQALTSVIGQILSPLTADEQRTLGEFLARLDPCHPQTVPKGRTRSSDV